MLELSALDELRQSVRPGATHLVFVSPALRSSILGPDPEAHRGIGKPAFIRPERYNGPESQRKTFGD